MQRASVDSKMPCAYDRDGFIPVVAFVCSNLGLRHMDCYVMVLSFQVPRMQANDALLFLKNLRSVALYMRDQGAASPKLLYRMHLSVPDVRA